MAKHDKPCKPCYTSIGGQALIEGILMRGPEKDAIAVRMPDGSIDLKVDPSDTGKKVWWKKVPLLRGLISFGASMLTGYKALMYSAEKSGLEDEDIPEEKMSKLDLWIEKHMGPQMVTVIGILSLVLGLGLSLLLFKFLPIWITDGLQWILRTTFPAWLLALLEGVLKMAIFIGYLAAVSLMKDIRTTFMYHGAEHKTIHCFEAGVELTAENAQKFPRAHPRCGTSFMFLMVALSILITAVMYILLPDFIRENTLYRMGFSLLLLPLIMGLGYEVLKICGKYDNLFTRIVSAPGKWIQRLTTKEPTLAQLEVAIAAMKAVIPQNDIPIVDVPVADTPVVVDGSPETTPTDTAPEA